MGVECQLHDHIRFTNHSQFTIPNRKLTIKVRKSHSQPQSTLQLVGEDRVKLVGVDRVSSCGQQHPKWAVAVILFTSLFIPHHKQKSIRIRTADLISLQFLSPTFPVLRIMHRDTIVNVHWPSCKVPVMLVRF